MRNFCFEHANAVCCRQLDGAPCFCYYLLLAANENAARREILYRQRKNKKPGINGREPCMNRYVKKSLHAFGGSFWNACVMPHFTKRLFALRAPPAPSGACAAAYNGAHSAAASHPCFFATPPLSHRQMTKHLPSSVRLTFKNRMLLCRIPRNPMHRNSMHRVPRYS